MDDSLPVYNVLENHGEFVKLLRMIDVCVDIKTILLNDDSAITFFAPNDDAFGEIDEMLASKNLSFGAILSEEYQNLIEKILKHHILEGIVMSDEILGMNGQNIKLSDGQSVKVRIENNAVTLGGASLIETDHNASNGVVHVISSVMIPENFKF